MSKGSSGSNESSKKTKEEVKLPIGFRFRPTDEELVVHYLKRRVMSVPLPASVIPDLHVFNFDPWSLPGDVKEKRYYFWERKGEVIRKKCSKVMPTHSGFWKPISTNAKPILSPGLGATNDVVGVRRTWTFYQAKRQPRPRRHFSKTRWFMHEFQLVDSTQSSTHDQGGEWVVCRVFQRKMRHKNDGTAPKYCSGENVKYDLGSESPSFMDFKLESNLDQLGPPLPSSPCSTTD